jgi:flagellin
MSLRINNNIAAVNAYRNLGVSDSQMAKSLEKLSSGFRINRAADDAASNEYQALAEEIDRLSTTTKFGSQSLLDGFSGTFQVGANSGETIDVDTMDTAIAAVSTGRGELGAVRNRLEHAIANLKVSIENVSAARS